MKVVFRGNETADVSEIQSVSVDTDTKRIEVHLKRKTEETEEKVRDLPLRKNDFEKTWAEEVKKDLEKFSEAPNTPIEQVITSRAWGVGYLQVELDVNSDTSARGLARLCWYWWLSKTPADQELELRTGLSADEIEKVASRDSYKQSIEDLMFEGYNTADKFKEWATKGKYSGNNPVWLGKRIRLREDTTTELINAVAEKHGIDLGDLKSSSAFFEAERTIGSGRQSVYLYYYQQKRESAESKYKNVWECKIGNTERPLQARLREQATDPEKFKLGLHIETNRPKDIERIIHDILKVRGKHIEEAPGREWFLTSPSEVEEIFKFIEE